MMMMNLNPITKWIVVFFAAAILDWIWAKYIQYTSGGRRLLAATFSALIAMSGGILSIEYIHDNWLLVPMIFGYFIGTYMSVKDKTNEVT